MKVEMYDPDTGDSLGESRIVESNTADEALAHPDVIEMANSLIEKGTKRFAARIVEEATPKGKGRTRK